jgi:hypothetical protein
LEHAVIDDLSSLIVDNEPPIAATDSTSERCHNPRRSLVTDRTIRVKGWPEWQLAVICELPRGLDRLISSHAWCAVSA